MGIRRSIAAQAVPDGPPPGDTYSLWIGVIFDWDEGYEVDDPDNDVWVNAQNIGDSMVTVTNGNGNSIGIAFRDGSVGHNGGALGVDKRTQGWCLRQTLSAFNAEFRYRLPADDWIIDAALGRPFAGGSFGGGVNRLGYGLTVYDGTRAAGGSGDILGQYTQPWAVQTDGLYRDLVWTEQTEAAWWARDPVVAGGIQVAVTNRDSNGDQTGIALRWNLPGDPVESGDGVIMGYIRFYRKDP